MMTTVNTTSKSLSDIRHEMRMHYLAAESDVVHSLVEKAQLTEQDRQDITAHAAKLISSVRSDSKPSMMEKFLSEYGLTTHEGVALMCLAEALLRVPDQATVDELIQDKVASGSWREHIGQSESALINSASWGLLITGNLLSSDDGKSLRDTVHRLIHRMGEPVIRVAVGQAMKVLGSQFVLGRTIDEATKRAGKSQKKGYTCSYDMLGEAARTQEDADRYMTAYHHAIKDLANKCTDTDIRNNPGISVKFSALHPRYEAIKKDRVLAELVPQVLKLALECKDANMGFNVDAEEADRLDLSLDVIEAVLSDERLAGWQGFGIVVQSYGPRAAFVLDWLYALAERLDRKIMVRLVKGAYWDAEIKRAQTLGLKGFPVFTRKVTTDVSYLACARQLLGMTDRIYPQFATHNAHTMSSVLKMSSDHDAFEFQRLHGMGESLHDLVLANEPGVRCRIYAPVGAHRDLLAYLVRRLLENGANSSFVNQVVDKRISPEQVAADPVNHVLSLGEDIASKRIAQPQNLFGASRPNSRGIDVTDVLESSEIEAEMQKFAAGHQWLCKPLVAVNYTAGEGQPVMNPSDINERVGTLYTTPEAAIPDIIGAAVLGGEAWSQKSAVTRADCLRRVADLYEDNIVEFIAIATREAGKTRLDAINEIREAVDFVRYYALQAEKHNGSAPLGVITCISPWNFPLAIFTGQIMAAVAAGNAVLAKPADQTPLIACLAVALMHKAGIPDNVVQLLPGSGPKVGQPLTSDPRINGVCFTGSTATAQRINQSMAENVAPQAPLVAETGGLNAMIVDSTALPEQVVRDVIASAFQSAGQRCSALRILYIQKDVADHLLHMLKGAMDDLSLDNPWSLATDIGPVIDEAARQNILNHIEFHRREGRVIKEMSVPSNGYFVGPAIIRLDGIKDLDREIFGPVLHVATFEAHQLDQVVDDINAKGFGLTFGLHTRVDMRVDQIVSRIEVGNTYVNRNQIGAIVGSQPFGGEGLSGTGPKAGGPNYLMRFLRSDLLSSDQVQPEADLLLSDVQQKIDQLPGWPAGRPAPEERTSLSSDMAAFMADYPMSMPGPTGESNILSVHAKGVVFCLAHDGAAVVSQVRMALAAGNRVVVVTKETGDDLSSLASSFEQLSLVNGWIDPKSLSELTGIDAVVVQLTDDELRRCRIALASREGVIISLATETYNPTAFLHERHLCVDTTAAGGNASLIAGED